MRAEISSEISSVSTAAEAAGARGAPPDVTTGAPHATIATNKRKGAKRTS